MMPKKTLKEYRRVTMILYETALLVYVAGPLSGGETAKNVYDAMQAGHAVMDAGHVPYIPHLDVIMTMQRPRPYEEWIAADFAVIRRCDILWRIPGRSPGAIRESAEALRLSIPVVRSYEELLKVADDIFAHRQPKEKASANL